jgi:hypothetical protein
MEQSRNLATQPCNATITQPCNTTITQPYNATITLDFTNLALKASFRAFETDFRPNNSNDLKPIGNISNLRHLGSLKFGKLNAPNRN